MRKSHLQGKDQFIDRRTSYPQDENFYRDKKDGSVCSSIARMGDTFIIPELPKGQVRNILQDKLPKELSEEISKALPKGKALKKAKKFEYSQKSYIELVPQMHNIINCLNQKQINYNMTNIKMH